MAEQTSDKAMLHEKGNASKRLVFGLNPTQVAFARNVKFNRNPAPNSHTDPPAQFTGTDATTLTLAILLDAMGTGTGSIQSQIDQLVAWTTVPGDQGTSASPPLLVFNWGSLKISNDSAFVGYLEQLRVTIEMFARNGTPLRASVNLSLKSATAPPAGTNPTSGAEKSRKRRVLRRGQTLQSLAFDEFGDAGAWRAVAEMNSIDDPTRLRPGLEVLLPDRRELVRSQQ